MTKKLHKPIVVPHEFHQALVRNKSAMKNFENMPPSHQHEYVDYIASAVQIATKRERIKKVIKDLQNK